MVQSDKYYNLKYLPDGIILATLPFIYLKSLYHQNVVTFK